MSYLARCFCLICLLLFYKTGYSQKIILIDNTNNIPVSDVTVFGKQSFKSIISNNKGIVDLEQFETVIFPAYYMHEATPLISGTRVVLVSWAQQERRNRS